VAERPNHPYGENINWTYTVSWPDQNDVRREAVKAEVTAPAIKTSVSLVSDGSSGDVALEDALASEMAALFELFKQRQRKYGPGNIAAFGDLGVCVRAQDKLARLRHHYFGGGAGDMGDESVEDAWRDLAVYAAIALVCRKGRWPGWVKP
jgi:hypothetical protein